MYSKVELSSVVDEFLEHIDEQMAEGKRLYLKLDGSDVFKIEISLMGLFLILSIETTTTMFDLS